MHLRHSAPPVHQAVRPVAEASATAQVRRPARIGFNAARPTVPVPIAATNPPQPAGIGHPAPDRGPANSRLAKNHDPTTRKGP